MHKRGFTLVELLVTVVIIGLLSAVATAGLVTAQRNARDDSRKANVAAIANAVEAYKLANKTYPGEVKTTSASLADTACSKDVLNTATIYYYNPNVTDTTAACGASYSPHPNWIPNLSPYLNPTPTETRYLGTSGTSTTNPTFSTSSNVGQPSGKTRTFSYVRTSSGYRAFAILEKPAATPEYYLIER